jgi:hypothetical protein
MDGTVSISNIHFDKANTKVHSTVQYQMGEEPIWSIHSNKPKVSNPYILDHARYHQFRVHWIIQNHASE